MYCLWLGPAQRFTARLSHGNHLIYVLFNNPEACHDASPVEPLIIHHHHPCSSLCALTLTLVVSLKLPTGSVLPLGDLPGLVQLPVVKPVLNTVRKRPLMKVTIPCLCMLRGALPPRMSSDMGSTNLHPSHAI